MRPRRCRFGCRRRRLKRTLAFVGGRGGCRSEVLVVVTVTVIICARWLDTFRAATPNLYEWPLSETGRRIALRLVRGRDQREVSVGGAGRAAVYAVPLGASSTCSAPGQGHTARCDVRRRQLTHRGRGGHRRRTGRPGTGREDQAHQGDDHQNGLDSSNADAPHWSPLVAQCRLARQRIGPSRITSDKLQIHGQMPFWTQPVVQPRKEAVWNHSLQALPGKKFYAMRFVRRIR